MSTFLENTERKRCSIHFDSMAELLNARFDNSDNERNLSNIYHNHGQSKRETQEWYGEGNFSEKDVISKSVYGDANLLTTLRMMNQQLSKTSNLDGEKDHFISKRRRKKRFSDQGDELDIHKVIAGHLDRAWRSTYVVKEDVHHSHTVIHIDIGGHWRLKQKETLWRAAVAIQVAEDLIKAGKSVKIVVGGSVSGLFVKRSRVNYVAYCSLTVKDYTEPLSLERLAVMANIGFHRAVLFRAKCLFPYKVASTLGYPSNYAENEPSLHVEKDGKDVRYIYIGMANSMADANREIRKINDKWSSYES